MGIAAELKPKTVLVKGGLAAEKLMSGEADIAMQPASELLAVPGAVLVGPIPLEVQTYIVYSGAVSAGARDQAAADALLPALAGPNKAAAAEEEGHGAALTRHAHAAGERASRGALMIAYHEKMPPLASARSPSRETLRPRAPSPPPSRRRSCGRCRRGRGPGSHSTCSRPS